MVTASPLPAFRVVAYSSANRGLPTYNILTAPTGEKANNQKAAIQLTAAQAIRQTHKTVQAAPSYTPGLPHIIIAGYSGPN